ncbi:MAG: hypothetical protein IPM53_25850 [Anaerolineaceae bacterium]|nr:hypothetical protein [Anaerolineaceae bacterium]
MNVFILILILFVGFSFQQYYARLENDFGFEEHEKRILSKQLLALLVVFLILILSVGSVFNDLPIISSPLWVLLMCLSLLFVGASSIVNKISVIRLRSFDPPKGILAVVFGWLLILTAVIVGIAYIQGDLFFGIFE